MWMIAQFLRDGKRDLNLWKKTKNENILPFKLLKFHKKVIINL